MIDSNIISQIYALYLGCSCKHKDQTSLNSMRNLISVGGYGIEPYITLRLQRENYDKFHDVSSFVKDRTWSIILNSLNDISDEDLLNVAKIVCERRQKANVSPLKYAIENKIAYVLNDKGAKLCKIQICNDGISYSSNTDMNDFYTPNQYKALDYLRSKRYAISYMGYSVKELVEEGIYNLNYSGIDNE